MTPFVPVTTTTVLDPRTELPATGSLVAFLLVCACLAIAFGLALRYANKLEDKG